MTLAIALNYSPSLFAPSTALTLASGRTPALSPIFEKMIGLPPHFQAKVLGDLSEHIRQGGTDSELTDSIDVSIKRLNSGRAGQIELGLYARLDSFAEWVEDIIEGLQAPQNPKSAAESTAGQCGKLQTLIAGDCARTQPVDGIFSIMERLGFKDRLVSQHSWRVAELASEFARWNGVIPDDSDLSCVAMDIAIGALLHDIGKIDVLTTILQKRGQLQPEEWLSMQNHPSTGERLADQMSLSVEILLMIRNHHERWDGRGYPDGLSGDKIPLAARIVAIVDSWDAMTSDRPYKDKVAPEQALQMFTDERDSGQWDPRLVDLFIEFMRAKMQEEG